MYSARNEFRTPFPARLAGGAVLTCLFLLAGCAEQWDYYSLHGVQTDLPPLMDKQWSRRRDYSEAEMLAVRPGGSQTLLIARFGKPGISGDVAQLDEDQNRTFIMVLDGPVKTGTYHITPDSGRLIESTPFRPAWRPYRGLEGDVTVLSVSPEKIVAAVRVSTVRLKASDPDRRLSGTNTFQTMGGEEPALREAQINVTGIAGDFPADAQEEKP